MLSRYSQGKDMDLFDTLAWWRKDSRTCQRKYFWGICHLERKPLKSMTDWSKIKQALKSNKLWHFDDRDLPKDINGVFDREWQSTEWQNTLARGCLCIYCCSISQNLQERRQSRRIDKASSINYHLSNDCLLHVQIVQVLSFHCPYCAKSMLAERSSESRQRQDCIDCSFYDSGWLKLKYKLPLLILAIAPNAHSAMHIERFWMPYGIWFANSANSENACDKSWISSASHLISRTNSWASRQEI